MSLRRASLVLSAVVVTAVPMASAAAAPGRSPAAKIAFAHRLRAADRGAANVAHHPAQPEIARLARALAARDYAVLVAHTDSALAPVVAAARHDGYRVRHALAPLGSVSVRVPRARVGAALARLRALPGVTSVEPIRYRAPSATPNDPDYATYQSVPLGAVHAPAAWDHSTGNAAVKIAILDTGIDTTHPDLAGKVVGSYNALDGSSTVTDADSHGTAMAGVAAAATNNGVGIAGAGWNTSLLAVKIADAADVVSSDDEAAGIVWAVDHGANVINLSVAGADTSQVEQNAVLYAQQQGTLVVAAAGNDATTTPTYPAAYPDVIAVGATDGAGLRAPRSDHGSWITVAAPGVDIRSTVPTGSTTAFPDGTTGYASLTGTSLSAALVSGEAALLFAHDPDATADSVRTAIVDSASGYVDQDLGAGQVDFAAAMNYQPPSSTPSAVTTAGTSGVVTVTATSTAPEVAFAFDGQGYSTPVAVQNGKATFAYSSYGHSNGTHTAAAVDCSSAGVCSTTATTKQFTVANPKPTITAPRNGATITGGFTVTATANGGGLALLIDGVERAFDASKPYSLTYTGSALSEGSHTLTVQACSTGGSCYGPVSSAVTIVSDSLHPSITSLSPAPFSPNGDHVNDTTKLTYRLPDTEDVYVSVYNSGNVKVYGPAHLGTHGAGTYSWVWNGRTGHNEGLSSGTYLVQLSTSRVVNGGTVRGQVGRHVTIDLSAPKLYSTTGGGTTFYPVADGYQDVFAPATTLSEPAHLVFQVRTTGGSVVRTIGGTYSARRVTVDWYGRNDRGDAVAPGTYLWSFTATDAAGNVRHGSTYHVYVSGKRLVHKSAVVKKNGDAFYLAGGTDGCAEADTSSSYYDHGVELLNTCGSYGEPYEIATAIYKIGLPAAARYDHLGVHISGYLFYSPSDVYAGYFRTDSDAVDVPYIDTLSGQGEGNAYLGGALGANHVNSNHVVEIGIAVAGSAADVSDFDLKYVQVNVDYEVLQ